jgi:hypothetical protein
MYEMVPSKKILKFTTAGAEQKACLHHNGYISDIIFPAQDPKEIRLAVEDGEKTVIWRNDPVKSITLNNADSTRLNELDIPINNNFNLCVLLAEGESVPAEIVAKVFIKAERP